MQDLPSLDVFVLILVAFAGLLVVVLIVFIVFEVVVFIGVVVIVQKLLVHGRSE